MYGPILLPSFDEVKEDKKTYAESFAVQYENTDPFTARPLAEFYGSRGYIVQNPPAKPLTQTEMDDVYALPYTERIHPMYEKLGGIPALEEIKFSLTSNRGCFGGCNFCALTFHQGRILQTRSHESLIREAERMTKDPEFKGYIHDVGGPTADFRQTSCQKQLTKGVCKNKQCLFPEPCKNLTVDHSDYVSLLRKLRKLSGVKKVFIRSGVRFDYVVADRDKTFLRELVEHHVSGQLRVAPEHVSDQVLKYMGKPSHSVYEKFLHEYDSANKKTGKQQYAVPYFMSSHPGCTMKEAVKLAEYVRDLGFTPEQVQDFYPTPSTLSTCMYYTGIHPLTGEKVYVPRNPHEKAIQRALMQYKNPENRELVLEGLKMAGRMDLVGYGPKCLIRPIREHSKNTSSESRSDKNRRSSGKTKTADRKNRIGGKQTNVRTQTNTRKEHCRQKKENQGRQEMTQNTKGRQNTSEKKVKKGDLGYFQSEKKRKLIITAILFAVPLFIFFTSWIYFKTRMTIWTVVTVVGCLPACKSLVGLIMILKCRPMDRKLYEQIREHQGELDMAYEMYMTFYEKSAYIDALAVCGNTVAAYSSDPKIHASYMEENCQKVVRKNGYKATVKIFTDLRPFLERLDSMNAHKDTLEEGIKFTPDEKYPELSRNELIRQTILALCL